jgi:hypothetical protein
MDLKSEFTPSGMELLALFLDREYRCSGFGAIGDSDGSYDP